MNFVSPLKGHSSNYYHMCPDKTGQKFFRTERPRVKGQNLSCSSTDAKQHVDLLSYAPSLAPTQ